MNCLQNLELPPSSIAKIAELLQVEDSNPLLLRYKGARDSLPYFKSSHLRLDQDCVEIGHPSELSQGQHERLLASLRAFIPWKKGPFRIFGHHIDSEWRSDWKWNRIAPHIESLKGKTIADIGCNNGYYMMRMAAQEPAGVFGFEPYKKYEYSFEMLQSFAQIPNLHFLRLGVEHMDLFPNVFDTVFCLGILYHHTDPVGLLRKIYTSLKLGGQLIVDCQGIPGDEPVSLTPRNRYTNAKGIWHLPTKSCLVNWMKRSGFYDVQVFYGGPLSIEEQRKTSEWAPIPSLAENLDPLNPQKTVEGYPAPLRFYVKACR